MKPMGISARQPAAGIDVSPSRISELVNGQRPVTAHTALRFGLFFAMEPRFWLNLQAACVMRLAERARFAPSCRRGFASLLAALRRPLDEDPALAVYAEPAPAQVTAAYRTFCGTWLELISTCAAPSAIAASLA